MPRSATLVQLRARSSSLRLLHESAATAASLASSAAEAMRRNADVRSLNVIAQKIAQVRMTSAPKGQSELLVEITIR